MKKKIFALTLLSVTLFACTNEGSETTADVTPITKNTSGDPAIDALYTSMLTTQEYIDYKAAQDAFIDKMNYNGTGDIYTSAKLLAWIDQNLSQTDFAKLSDAEAELADVNTLGQAYWIKNRELFEAIAVKPNPGQVWADLTVDTTVYGDNPCDCTGNLINALIDININCGSDFNDALGPAGSAEQGIEVLNEWNAAESAAADAFLECIKACFG